ncbi:hypothetical protein GCM10009839_57100 [Catenulispora yoronensis]|uniref:Phosphodiester glycosidase domain-containing protein n=1 Tax=Catenulispora yoronensis TaxID=450799 RepID=A0ABP5GHR7_9ACTN
MGSGAGSTVMSGVFLASAVMVVGALAACGSPSDGEAAAAQRHGANSGAGSTADSRGSSGAVVSLPSGSGSLSSSGSSSPSGASGPSDPSSSPAEPSPDLLDWKASARSGVEVTGDEAAFAARFDPTAVRFVLHAGSQVPGGSGWLDANAASTEQLVAGWNGGFLMANNASQGGFYLGGRTAFGPLRAGTASEVFYKNGSMDIVAWPGGAPGPDVAGVRQNLGLMIDGGELAGNLDQGTAADERTWGFTNDSSNVHGNRSGVGIRADGKIVYAAVRGASPLQLAQYLRKAGAVRAMELDINFSRPIFGTYAEGRWTQPAPWLGPAVRFTSGNERDFVVVYQRQ